MLNRVLAIRASHRSPTQTVRQTVHRPIRRFERASNQMEVNSLIYMLCRRLQIVGTEDAHQYC